MADATPDTKPAAEVKDVKPVTAGDEDDHVDASKLKLPEGVQLAQAPENKGEDEEETLFKQLCKMYRFVKGEWKERGTGDVKILQHKGHKKVRLVMREDRTFNVRANHLIDPEANLEANAGSDRGWVWRAMDFSDGEFKEEVFAIRFKETSTADEFKAAFVNAQGVNKKLAEGAGGESKPEAAAEAEKPEAAAAADSVDKKRIVIGSRSSDLAMAQAVWVQGRLSAAHPDYTFSIETLVSHGDKVLDKSLPELAATHTGLFTKELEVGLLTKQFRIVVHSLKDMPTTLPEGLTLAAITEREQPEDVLLLHPDYASCKGLADLPEGAVVGTSSVRREAMVRHKYPHLKVQSIRGNLNTRYRKLMETNDYAAIILARAGVVRMGWEERIACVLPTSEFYYAVGQGALGVECRTDDEEAAELIRAVEDVPSASRCKAERAFLRGLQGGCQVPIGVDSSFEDGVGKLTTIVLSPDGSTAVGPMSIEFTPETAVKAGEELADQARAHGADKFITPGARPITYGSAETAGLRE